MKKIFTFVSAAVLALSLQAAELDTIQVDGIYYQINKEDSIATLIRLNNKFVYEIDEVEIPVDVEKDDVKYPVVALGQGAFCKTTASKITFAEGSKVTELGMQTFQAAINVEEIELPEGIKVIPLTCFNNATAATPTKTKSLTFPASLDSMAINSVTLPQLEFLEFKGVLPPKMAIKETTWKQNAWMISATHANNTAKTAVVLVPKAAVEAYKATPEIGDYFTTILAVKDTIEENGLFFELDNRTKTATLIQAQNAAKKYEQESIVIPVSVTKDDIEYPVVELGRRAFNNSTATSITFAEGSQVTILGQQSFQAAVELLELELPEGVKIIPTSGIHNSTKTNPMKMKKLVFPASLDSLCVISIALPQLETLEFKGAVPPSIATKETATWTQNPWQISTTNPCNTNKEAVVIVPDGSLEAYQNTAWIGDYFTTIIEKKDAPTAIDEVNTDVKTSKTLRDGQIIILRGGQAFTLTGQEIR